MPGSGPTTSAKAQQDHKWWRVFIDPAPEQILAEAQRSNPGVTAPGARIMEARAQLGIAGEMDFWGKHRRGIEAADQGRRAPRGGFCRSARLSRS